MHTLVADFMYVTGIVEYRRIFSKVFSFCVVKFFVFTSFRFWITTFYTVPPKRRTTAASSSAGGKIRKGVEDTAGSQGNVSSVPINTSGELFDDTASTNSGTISNSTGPQQLRSFCDSLGVHLTSGSQNLHSKR